MDSWSVHLEIVSEGESCALQLLDAFMERLATRGFSPSVQGGSDRYAARVSVTAESFDEAMTTAAQAVRRAAKDVGLPSGHIVRAEVMTEGELDAELARPQLPELIGTGEVASMLGVSRQRVNELRSEGRRVIPPFPKPLVTLATGPVWDAKAIRTFMRRWERKPGRPTAAGARKAG